MQDDSDTNSLEEDINDLSLQDFQTLQKPKDRLINSYDYHEDSVYSTSWSSANPWVFASLSYDGRLVFNLVPQDEKYKILL
jgi:WD40 repeat protein